MNAGRIEHWQEVYSTRPVDRLGWYRPRLDTSLHWIKAIDLPRDAPVIDVGCGASNLVDDLLDAGFSAITALDVSQNALEILRQRLGDKAAAVEWIAADVTAVELPAGRYRLWHDRAALHFLIDPGERARYRQQLSTALCPGGHVIIGVFAPEAPPRCSGLPVHRYALDDLLDLLGEGFELVKHANELHVTPGGVEQAYLYCHLVKVD
jgi:SAM-dependent methyltransferase